MKYFVIDKYSLFTWLWVYRWQDGDVRGEISSGGQLLGPHWTKIQTTFPGCDFANNALDSGAAKGKILIVWLTTALQLCILAPWATQRTYTIKLLYKLGKGALIQPEGKWTETQNLPGLCMCACLTVAISWSFNSKAMTCNTCINKFYAQHCVCEIIRTSIQRY